MRPSAAYISNSAFTLIELLVVIAIIAILAVVVVVTLNPAELLRQSHDANRVSDMATLQSAINLYSTDQAGTAGFSLGVTSTSYLSIPSSASNCSTLGMASSAYSYACSTSANYRTATSLGWLPINFQNLSSGNPLGSLPVDPVNQTSSGLYYSYETGGSTYAINTFMESQKYAKSMDNGAGVDPALYQAGSGASVLPDASRGLVGYWPLNEGSGSTVYDWSGEGNNGALSGPTWAPGKISASALQYYGGTGYGGSKSETSLGSAAVLNPSVFTINAWVDTASSTWSSNYIYSDGGTGSTWNGITFYINGATLTLRIGSSSLNISSGGVVPSGTWTMVSATYDGANVALYVNGSQVYSGAYGGGVGQPASYASYIGDVGAAPVSSEFAGLMADVRLYDRALSAAEIQEIYNAEK